MEKLIRKGSYLWEVAAQAWAVAQGNMPVFTTEPANKAEKDAGFGFIMAAFRWKSEKYHVEEKYGKKKVAVLEKKFFSRMVKFINGRYEKLVACQNEEELIKFWRVTYSITHALSMYTAKRGVTEASCDAVTVSVFLLDGLWNELHPRYKEEKMF